MSKKLGSYWNITAIVLLAFALRMLFNFLVPAEPRGDAYIYSEAARRMAAGLGYIRNGEAFAIFPVGWPAFLALIYRLTGDSLRAARFVNILLSLLTVYCSYEIARRVFNRPQAAAPAPPHTTTDQQKSAAEHIGLGTALLMALYPNHIAYTALLFTETYFTALLFVGVALLLREGVLWWRDVLTGIIFGVAVLTKPQVLFIPLMLIAWQWWQHRPPLRSSLQRSVTIYLLLVAVIAPWLYRNYTVFDDFVFISTNGGFNLYIGNNPQAEGFYKTTPEIWAAIGDEDEAGPAAELRRDQKARELALEWMAAHPLDVLRLAFLKALGMYRDNTEGIGWATNGAQVNILPLRYLTWVLYPLLWLLALLYPLLWRRWRARDMVALPALPLLLVAYFTAITMVFFADERFSFPVVPFVFMYSIGSLVLWGRQRHGRLRRNLR